MLLQTSKEHYDAHADLEEGKRQEIDIFVRMTTVSTKENHNRHRVYYCELSCPRRNLAASQLHDVVYFMRPAIAPATTTARTPPGTTGSGTRHVFPHKTPLQHRRFGSPTILT